MGRFRDIVGHEQTISQLQSAVRSGKISHAYLIAGDAGMGKRTLARAFAQTLQCTGRGEEPDACGKCPACRKAESDNHPDIITWRHEKPRTFSVDEVRALVEDVQIKPFTETSARKIYIIPDAQLMNQQAQNALLKTLEEPPAYGVLLLLTTNADAMLETIRSRTIVLNLRPLPGEKIRKYLTEELQIPDYEAEIYEAFAQNNLGRAIALTGSEDFRTMMDSSFEILTNIKEWSESTAITKARALSDEKARISDYLELFTLWYRDVLLFKATRDADGLILKEHVAEIRRAAQLSSYAGVETILSAIQTAEKRLQANVSFELVMELLFLTMRDN